MRQPLPDCLERVVAPIIRDFQVPTPIPVRLGYTPGCLWIEEVDDAARTGCSIPQDVCQTDEELTVFLADFLQEQFFLETACAWGEPRPPCPEHPHPLSAAMVDATPYWICPRDGRLVAPIGRLADSGL